MQKQKLGLNLLEKCSTRSYFTTGDVAQAKFNFGTNQPTFPYGGFTFDWKGIIMFLCYNIGSIVGFLFNITLF